MIDFMNTLPAVLARLHPDIMCVQTRNDDGESPGWHVFLPNAWRVCLRNVYGEIGLTITARPNIPGSLPFNFNPAFDPDDIRPAIGERTPQEVIALIRLIMELPSEIPSDLPDSLDLVR